MGLVSPAFWFGVEITDLADFASRLSSQQVSSALVLNNVLACWGSILNDMVHPLLTGLATCAQEHRFAMG